jgi:hypothetical protein
LALTLLDTFAPPAGAGSDDLIGRATKALGPPGGTGLNKTVRGLLQDALLDARGDVDRFRASIERSFDEVMDRASGWYKRKVQLILFALALALVVGINADSFALGQRLWKDDALRATVVAQANRAVQAGQSSCPSASPSLPAMTKAADCVDDVAALGIPLGWSHDTTPHGLVSALSKLLGLLVTTFALTLGAPFWFDLLGKVAHLRGSGPPASGATGKATAAEPAA